MRFSLCLLVVLTSQGIVAKVAVQSLSFVAWYCPLLKLTERLGLSTQNNPRKQRWNANSFVLRVEALPSGIVLGGQTQSLREFQEWAIPGICLHRVIAIWKMYNLIVQSLIASYLLFVNAVNIICNSRLRFHSAFPMTADTICNIYTHSVNQPQNHLLEL